MMLTGAQILVKVLLEQGVDTVFGYPGGAVLYIYDELYKNSDSIVHYTTCHEQGACHAADGYARATGKTGVVFATSGPGATNLVTGIANAYLDSVPLVAITGNVSTDLLGRDSFQEVDITGITMPITKHNYLVKDVSVLADTLREAFHLAQSGRPGPVLVDIPKDVQIGSAEYEPPSNNVSSKKAPQVNEDMLNQAALLISKAKRPYIYCGGGVVGAHASEELMRLADKVDAPIGLSIMGLSTVPYSHPRFLGMVGMHGRYGATKALYECDLLIAVGVRFSDRATGNKSEFTKDRKVIQIDIDPAEINKNIDVTTALIGDTKTILQALNSTIETYSHPEWMERIRYIKEHPDNSLEMDPRALTPQSIIEGACVKNGKNVVCTDVGQHQMWTTQYYRFTKPRTFITSGGLGTMGFGMGAAVGASIGRGNARTLLFTSDGSFHMNMNELATAVSNKLPIVIVMLDNNALGMVRQWQKLFFDGRYSQTSLERQTDYVKLAEAFGAAGFYAETVEEYGQCLEKAYQCDGPALIHCRIDNDMKVLPMIPPGGSINDIILK
ncbi:MAG: biosynthetic-type acetolactate synthase large subunit [Eubacteriales bacterium]|jgi:acetolactate synthase-1/2/3 large subunit